jgi:DDE superfamily endonuclease
VVRVSGRGSGRISVAGLACFKAGQPSRFSCRMQDRRLRPGTRWAMSEQDYASLITAAHRYMDVPVIVIWDNLNTHLSRKMRSFVIGHPDWLTVIQLPACAPDLNPIEGAWPVMKNSLGNLAPGHHRPARRRDAAPARPHPATAQPHHRIPRPDRTHPRLPAALTFIIGPVIDLGCGWSPAPAARSSDANPTMIQGPKVRTAARAGDYAVRRSASASSRSPKG